MRRYRDPFPMTDRPIDWQDRVALVGSLMAAAGLAVLLLVLA